MVIISLAMGTRTKVILTAVIILSIVAPTTRSATLGERIDALLAHPRHKDVRFGICIIKADSAVSVYRRRDTEPLIPASNMKLITTAAAVELLKPDFEYHTKVGLCGETLVVLGSGDPLLGDDKTDSKYGRSTGWVLDEIALALTRRGVSRIKDIIVDSTVFDDQRTHPSWPADQLNRWYACEVCGLNYNGNCVSITAVNNRSKVSILIEPPTSYLGITSKVKAITSGTNTIGSYRTAQPNRIVVFGRCKDRTPAIDVAIEKPAAFFGFLLAERLAANGIRVTGDLLEKPVEPNCDMTVLKVFTHSLKDCLARCNKDSFGLAAEALLKTIAARSNPGKKNGSWSQGRKVLSEYLRRLGIDRREFYIDDGSGFSRNNRLSANAIARVLLRMYHSDNWPLFRDSLAVGGRDGTIARYFREKKYRGRILGKTGYIRAVKSFSGVCTASGGDYIFSIIANGANGHTRDAINNIAKAIIDTAP